MNTHRLESKELFRASVTKATVLAMTGTSLLLKTEAIVASKRQISSADSDMLNQQQLASVGETVEGRLQLDLLSDTLVRVRYAEGDCVPVNDTPMVVGTFDGPTAGTIRAGGDAQQDIQSPPWLGGLAGGVSETLIATTAALTLVVTLAPFRLEMRDSAGKLLCGVGGKEKDNFCNWDSYNTGICRAVGTGMPIAVENFDLAYDECIYGLGEKFIALDKVGQTTDLNMVDALGVTTPRSYKNIPFFVSNKGYGVYFNHSSLMTYWVGSMSAVDVQVAAEDDFLDYYIMTGTIKEVLATYTELTGKGSMPPAWTFGYWQSKISYKSAEETLELARQMRAHQIPCDVIHLDTHWFKADWYCDLEFDPERFPDPTAYLQELAELGIKISLWQLPYIPEGSALFSDLKAVDGFVKNAEGEIYDSKICFTPGFKGIVGVVDYTNPAAVRVHQDYFRRLFRQGAKVIKTDFGEAAPLDGVYHDGTPGHQMHNRYPLLYNKAIFDVTKEATGDGVVWARSAWAGNQRYPLHWGGDNSPNYPNMLPQLLGGLSFGLSGFQFWSQDIGGFCGGIDEKLLIRWMQLGMFLSHSRIHGFGDREIYKFSPETQRICTDYIRLRYRLMPYILGTAQACVEQSLPMARPLVVEYQDDPTVWRMGDEFLLGNGILVAPIFTEDGHRRIYLPKGMWTDWWDKHRIIGDRWIEVDADLEILPLFIREGAMIPLGPVMNFVDERPIDKLDLVVSLFSSDGISMFNVPVNGTQVPLVYVAKEGTHTLTIGPCEVPIDLEVHGDGELQVVRR
jgi:alpha-D-xyloside xylohydrolase